MTGGLIQLITTGIQDSPLIGNPEITFFKKVYRHHTQFSINNNERYIDSKSFNSVGSKIVERNGDLLLNQLFKLEIPYFNILNTTVNSKIVEEKYNLKSLDINFLNTDCIIFCDITSESWYIIPEYLFKLTYFEGVYYDINITELQKNLLPEYIKLIDLGENVRLYQIQDSSVSPIISLLRINSNFFEQFWLNYVTLSNDVDLSNKLYTVNSNYINIFNKLKTRLYSNYYNANFLKKNQNYYNFNFYTEIKDEFGEIIYKTETERYLEYINAFNLTIQKLDKFDIDKCYNYCNINFLSFNDYKNNILPYNSLIIKFMLNMIYPSVDTFFTF